MAAYLKRALEVKGHFETFDIQHIPGDRNAQANALATEVSGSTEMFRGQGIIRSTGVVSEIRTIDEIELGDWRSSIMRILKEEEPEVNKQQLQKFKRITLRYTIIDRYLYRRSLSKPMLHCLNTWDANYALREVHEGICENHSEARTLAQKVIQAEFFWPTTHTDAEEIVRKCEKCQRFANILNTPVEKMTIVSVPYPFMQWGIDILGRFPLGRRQLKFLIIAIDYFTKWVEVEPLEKSHNKTSESLFGKTLSVASSYTR